VPIPWEGDAPSFGFGPSDESWLPQPPVYGELAVDRQTGVEGSTLELYRTLLRLRRELRPGRGELTWQDLGDHALAFEVSVHSGAPLRVIANVGGNDPVPLPNGVEILVASGEVDPAMGVPKDCAVWVR
jgi:alpha-glucosidase